MVNRVKIWGLGWPVHDLNLVIFEPRSGFFALVFRVIVLLKEDILVLFLEILDRSQEFILQNAAIKVKVYPFINLGSIANSIPRHTVQPHIIKDPPPCLSVGSTSHLLSCSPGLFQAHFLPSEPN